MAYYGGDTRNSRLIQISSRQGLNWDQFSFALPSESHSTRYFEENHTAPYRKASRVSSDKLQNHFHTPKRYHDIDQYKQSSTSHPRYENGNSEKEKKPTSKIKTLTELLNEFGNESTTHGIPRVITSKHWWAKCFWFLLCCGFAFVFGLQGYRLITEYIGNPYNTKIDVITKTNVKFPAVTVCNMNRMRRTKLIDTRFEDLVRLDGGISSDYDSWFWDYVDSFDYERSSSSVKDEKEMGTDSSMLPTEESGHHDEQNGNSQSSILPTNQNEHQNDDITKTPTTLYSSTTDSTSVNDGPESESFDDDPSVELSVESTEELESSNTKDDGGRFPSRFKRRILERTANHRQKRQFFDRWDNGYNYDYESSSSFSYDYYYGKDWWDHVQDDNDWAGFVEQSTSDDFSDIADVANPTRKELDEYGHQAEDFIVQCSFDKNKCNYTDFWKFQNSAYGNCFTFNHGFDNRTIQRTSKTGAQYGLQLTLFVEEPQYVGILTPELGVRVSIHPHDNQPFPQDVGITAPTGMSSSIGIRQFKIERLGGKYSVCTNSGEGTAYNHPVFKYTTLACKRQCLQNELERQCGCVTDVLENDEIPKCSITNDTQQTCSRNIITRYNAEKLDCSCPDACMETLYPSSVSTAVWPSDRYEQHLGRKLASVHPELVSVVGNVANTRKNLARIKIYFEELNYQQVTQTPVWSVAGISGAVGGLMGLYLGISAVSIVEIIILLFNMFVYIVSCGGRCFNGALNGRVFS